MLYLNRLSICLKFLSNFNKFLFLRKASTSNIQKTLPEKLFHLNLDISHYCQKDFQPWCHLNGLIDAVLITIFNLNNLPLGV